MLRFDSLRISKIHPMEMRAGVLQRWRWEMADDRVRHSRLFIGQANDRLAHLRESRARSTTIAIGRRGHGLAFPGSDLVVLTRPSQLPPVIPRGRAAIQSWISWATQPQLFCPRRRRLGKSPRRSRRHKVVRDRPVALITF